METQVIEHKRQHNEGKFHNPLPPDLVPVKQKYELQAKENALISVKPRALDLIEDQDMLLLLDRYSRDETVDLINLSECFGISITTLRSALKSPKWAEAYAAAKSARASMLLKISLESASMPYELIMSGEEISPTLVKAAALRSNQFLAIAKVVDPELAGAQKPLAGAIQATGTVNIQVNSGVTVKDF